MRSLYLGVLVFVAGCTTHFVGSPHIDVNTCQARCHASGMEMSGLVFMGEYSSACICEPPRSDGSTSGAAAGALGAAAGVMMQMEQEQQQQQQTWHPRAR